MTPNIDFKSMPTENITLKDLLNWFTISYRKAYNYYSSKSKYFQGQIEISYLGTENSKNPHGNITIHLGYSAAWSFDAFEQVNINVPTEIEIVNQESFGSYATTSSGINSMAYKIKQDLIFKSLLENKISNHTIDYFEHLG